MLLYHIDKVTPCSAMLLLQLGSKAITYNTHRCIDSSVELQLLVATAGNFRCGCGAIFYSSSCISKLI